MLRIITLALLLAASVSPALAADKKPKGAVDLTKPELTAIYSGKSIKWLDGNDGDAIAYFAPDGVILMYGPKKDWYGEGKWTVRSNKMCQSITWHAVGEKKSGKSTPHCWTYARDPGGKLWSIHSSGGKSDGWWDGENKRLSNGDKVTKTYNALKAKAVG